MAEATATEETKQYSEKVEEILTRLSDFTLLELSELVDAFEDRFGITPAAAPVAMMAAGGGAEAEEEVEPSSYKVVLKSFGEKKIQVIKAVRSETSLALREAKAVVEDVPSTIKDSLSKEDAEKCMQVLIEAGADAEVQAE